MKALAALKAKRAPPTTEQPLPAAAADVAACAEPKVSLLVREGCATRLRHRLRWQQRA